jgi:[histone H3]-dimethyl-L-lysine9 demethylase
VAGEQRCVTPVTPSAPSPVPCSSPVINQVPASPPQPNTPKGKIGAAKIAFRKATASVNPSMLNGHGESAHENDSSSDEPALAQKKSPAKRKAKVKRRKGGKKPAVQEEKTKKKAPSDSDSEKESGTEKDSEDSVSSNKRGGGKETSGGSNGGTSSSGVNNGGAKKRGRRPKSKNDEPRPPKKARGAGGNDDGSPTPPPLDPNKPPISQLKKTGESFLQDGHCFEVAPKLAKCRECRLTQNQRNKEVYNNIFCRFYYFRRLRYTKNGQLAVAGFSDPHLDAKEVSRLFYFSKKSTLVHQVICNDHFSAHNMIVSYV